MHQICRWVPETHLRAASRSLADILASASSLRSSPRACPACLAAPGSCRCGTRVRYIHGWCRFRWGEPAHLVGRPRLHLIRFFHRPRQLSTCICQKRAQALQAVSIVHIQVHRDILRQLGAGIGHSLARNLALCAPSRPHPSPTGAWIVHKGKECRRWAPAPPENPSERNALPSSPPPGALSPAVPPNPHPSQLGAPDLHGRLLGPLGSQSVLHTRRSATFDTGARRLPLHLPAFPQFQLQFSQLRLKGYALRRLS